MGVKNTYYPCHGIHFGTKIIKFGPELTMLRLLLSHTWRIFNVASPRLYGVSHFDFGSNCLEKTFESDVYIKN